jgi:triosephosphate isomerase
MVFCQAPSHAIGAVAVATLDLDTVICVNEDEGEYKVAKSKKSVVQTIAGLLPELEAEASHTGCEPAVP